MTEIAPTTPVLVGVAAVQQKLDEAGAGHTAIELMGKALRRAADDAGSTELLRRADRVEVPEGIWSYTDPARLLAVELGCEQAETVFGAIGVLQQTLMNRACASIAAGEADIVLVSGGEAKYRALRAQIAGVELEEETETGGEPDVKLTPDAEIWSDVESAAGLGMPVGYYAILDSALRRAQGLSVEEHRDQMGKMYAEFSNIAAANEDAWTREPVAAETVREASPKNRMLAFPYAKLHNSQWNVDQAAGLIFCSAAIAEELGIPREKWVFPLATTESNAMSVVAARKDLHRSYGWELAGRKALELAGKSASDIHLMELYSCFPFAVRIQLQEMGLDPQRPLSVTGAMTFGGGPLNNFVLQVTVKMAQLLRRQPGETGMVTSISGMNTKQACALYSTQPGEGGWQFADVTEAVREATELCEIVGDYAGPAVIAGYTVLYQGENAWRGVAVLDLPDGRRTVAYSEDPSVIEAMHGEECCGRDTSVDEGVFSLQ